MVSALEFFEYQPGTFIDLAQGAGAMTKGGITLSDIYKMTIKEIKYLLNSIDKWVKAMKG